MKKHITATILLLSILCCSLGCGSKTEKVIYSGDTVRFDAEQVGSSYLAYNEYLKHVKEHDFPEYYPLWSWFSVLGKYSLAQVYEDPTKENVFRDGGEYIYKYTNPNTHNSVFYTVSFITLGENSNLTFQSKKIKNRLTGNFGDDKQFVYGKLSGDMFLNDDPSEYCGTTNYFYYLVDDRICISGRKDHYVENKAGVFPVPKCVAINFIYDDVLYTISTSNNTVNEDDSDLMRRLLNFDTCEEAVQELINFQEAQTAK